MARHSIILAWEIPETEEPCGLLAIFLPGKYHVVEAWTTTVHGFTKELDTT